MIPSRRRFPGPEKRAFTLIELVAVTAVLSILLLVAARLLGDYGFHARKAGADMIAGLVDQARAAAVSSRSRVILAVAEPGDLPATGKRCHLALFRVESWPERAGDPVKAALIRRWQALESGVVLLDGGAGGVSNLLDEEQLTILYGRNHGQSVHAHAMVIHPHGGLHYPQGSSPVAIRIAEGGYQGGTAIPRRRGESRTIAENLLKIGRVTARAYRSGK